MTQSKLSHTLTSDNLPALLAPRPCAMCNGSGTVNATSGDEPWDENIVECEDCGGTGLLPYPGTFEQQTVDFISEVLAPIEQLLRASAQSICIMYNPDSEMACSFSIAPNWREGYQSNIGVYCCPSLEASATAVFDKIKDQEANGEARKQLDADVEAFRSQRAAELGLRS